MTGTTSAPTPRGYTTPSASSTLSSQEDTAATGSRLGLRHISSNCSRCIVTPCTGSPTRRPPQRSSTASTLPRGTLSGSCGYLTIKGYIPEARIFELGFPNREVEEGFLDFLLPYYTPLEESESGFAIWEFIQDVRAGNVDGFIERLQRFLADCPYEMARDVELHYQNVLFIVFRLAGLYTQVEYHTSRGRIDMVVQTADYVYVMEFKLDGSAEQALQQIEEKQYDLPFAADSRKVFRIGVNFSSETRNIDRWIVE